MTAQKLTAPARNRLKARQLCQLRQLRQLWADPAQPSSAELSRARRGRSNDSQKADVLSWELSLSPSALLLSVLFRTRSRSSMFLFSHLNFQLPRR